MDTITIKDADRIRKRIGISHLETDPHRVKNIIGFTGFFESRRQIDGFGRRIAEVNRMRMERGIGKEKDWRFRDGAHGPPRKILLAQVMADRTYMVRGALQKTVPVVRSADGRYFGRPAHVKLHFDRWGNVMGYNARTGRYAVVKRRENG